MYGKTPWITLNGLDVAGNNFVFRHLAKATPGGGGDLELTLGPVEKAVSSAMRIMLDESFDRCLRMDRDAWRLNRASVNICGINHFFLTREQQMICIYRVSCVIVV